MKVHCYPAPGQADREKLQGMPVVVIDVLRATSSIVAMLESGARQVIPVVEIETASRLVGADDHGVRLLAGERQGLRIEGFDLGNSPLEFTPEAVGGKTIVLTTSNGTPAIVTASKASRLLVCSINNVGAVARAVAAERRLVILCSGADGGFASEDLLCAGLLLEQLMEVVDTDTLDDAGRLALLLAGNQGAGIEDFLRSCDRGRKLISLGFEDDLVHCAGKDTSILVPEAKRGAISA